MDNTAQTITPKKTFSRIGWAMSAILVIMVLLQLLYTSLPSVVLGRERWFSDPSWNLWIGSFAPLYLVAIPVGLLLMRKLPAAKPEEHKLGTGNFFVFLPICFCLLYSGNLIGTLLSLVLSGGTAENALIDLLSDNNPLKLLVSVVLAPLLEEYVCRKQIIDRTGQYGEKTAVFLSALVFGLLHNNLFQFFYAFALGCVFGYIYIRTGRLRYTVILHSIVNFMGSVVAPWILNLVDLEALETMDTSLPLEELLSTYQSILPGLGILVLYALFLIVLVLIGLILLIIKCNRLIWKEAPEELPKGSGAKTVYLNVGMIVYMVLCVAAMIAALF